MKGADRRRGPGREKGESLGRLSDPGKPRAKVRDDVGEATGVYRQNEPGDEEEESLGQM